MKKLICLFALILVDAAFAADTATVALQKALPENQYDGFTEQNEPCTVDVIRERGQTRIELSNTGTNRFILVENASYSANPEIQFFSSSLSVTNADQTQVEITFMTERISPVQRKVTFQRVFRSNSHQWTSAQVCLIDN